MGSQHITLIEGYLNALISSRSIAECFELVLCASKSTLAALPDTLISKFKCRPVPVMNPEKRRLIRKTFVELFVVLRYIVKLRPGDILFISCVLPTTLWLMEISNRFLRKNGVHVVLHGEIEALFDRSPQSFSRFGYWVLKWFHFRKAQSRIKFVVLDDFQKDRLVAAFPEKLNDSKISVIHHPVSPVLSGVESFPEKPAVCFIGYRTLFKGFDQFARMAAEHPAVRFLAIGGGIVEDVRTGMVHKLKGENDYLMQISKCSAALFPYTAGYVCSLSAAAIDALSAGVHIVASDRPFFRSLATYFGSEIVTVCSSIDEFSLELASSKLPLRFEKRAFRFERILSSKYGLSAVQRSFERFVSSNIS